jgi:hypothetical protein
VKRQSLEALGAIPVSADLMPMESAGRVLRGIAGEMAASFIDDMSQPAARAGFTASLLTSVLLARARMGFVPSVAIAVMVGVSVEHLYGMAEDIHEKLTADAAKPV